MTGQFLFSHTKGYIIAVIIVLLFSVLPFVLDVEVSYLISFLYMTFLYISLSQAWNLIAGYAGQMSLGTHAFFGLGAYITALIWKAKWTGYLDPMAMFLSGAGAALLAILIGIPLLAKLRGDYFALGTLGLGEVIRVVMINCEDITGGASGVMLPSSNYESMTPYYYIALGISILTVITVWLLARSWVGLGFVAVREDELGAAANGVPVLRLKIITFSVSAFFMGLCGSINAYYMFHIHPAGALSLNWCLLPILMTILGGAGTFLGPILGSFILAGIFELANIWMPILHPIFSGVFIILVTVFLPRGIMSFLGVDGYPVISKLFAFQRSGQKNNNSLTSFQA